MASKLSNVRQALELLSDKKIDGVAELLKGSEGITKAELEELAVYFDHSIPYSGQHQFKLVLVQRKAGNIPPKGLAQNKAYETGGIVAWQLQQNLNKGEPENILKAIDDVLKTWKEADFGKAPAEKTLMRNYYFYKKTCSSNAGVGFLKKLKFPKLKKGTK